MKPESNLSHLSHTNVYSRHNLGRFVQDIRVTRRRGYCGDRNGGARSATKLLSWRELILHQSCTRSDAVAKKPKISVTVKNFQFIFCSCKCPEVSLGPGLVGQFCHPHHLWIPSGVLRRIKEREVGGRRFSWRTNLKLHTSLMLTLHWPELSHMVTLSYKGDRDMQSLTGEPCAQLN